MDRLASRAHLAPGDPTLAICPRGAGNPVVGPLTQHNVGVKSGVEVSHGVVIGPPSSHTRVLRGEVGCNLELLHQG